jgi:hypothetical protein
MTGSARGLGPSAHVVYKGATVLGNLKQPVAGIISTLAIIALSLGFISLFSLPTFNGPVSYFLLCLIPMQIVVAVVWETAHPSFAAKHSQPMRGILLTLISLGAAIVIAPLALLTVGRGVYPPTPMLMHLIIVAVAVTFWGAIIWAGFPFRPMIKNAVAGGIVMLLACYAVNYLLFRVFFSYEFMRGAPVYEAAQDPHGMFNALSALVFYVTALAIMFLLLHFDLWPLTKSAAVMKQPLLGIVWTVLCLVGGAIIFHIGIRLLHVDVMAFLILVPVPFIFGTIFVLNMIENSLFAKMTQPWKGVANTIAAIVIGTTLAWIYGLLAPAVSGSMKAGPPKYDYEVWLANALLSVTFPFLIFYAEFFKMWPLKMNERNLVT